MLKFISRTVVLLLIGNGLLLYIHFSQSGSATSNDLKLQTYSQEIEVTNRLDGLYIRHHFSRLTEGRYEIVWPESSMQRSCYLSDATSTACSHLDENRTAFVDGENDRQSITYVIPKKEPMQGTFLFKAPFVELHKGNVESTIFHITDETGIGGFWVNGLKQVGHKNLELIDYSLFQGSGKVTDLYWQKDIQPLVYEGERLSVYGEFTDLEGLAKADTILRSLNTPHSTAVIESGKPSVNSKRFIIAETNDAESVSDALAITSMFTQFKIPENQHLIAESVASILSGKGTGSKKSYALYDELINALTENEVIGFVEKLKGLAGEAVDASVLDKLIGEVTGFGTSYYTKNSEEGTVFYPFLLEDPRNVLIDGKENPKIRLLLKDNKIFYPATEILELTGYTIRFNEQSLYIENEMRRFRFPLRDPFYVYNEQKFNIVSPPFEIIEGEFYFEESWLIRLFIFNIEKKAETISIIPMTMSQEKEVPK